MSQLVIVGTVAFDAIETPFGKTDKILGGAATYIGLSAAQYQAKGALVSVVGGDFPAQYLELLESRGMDTSGIEIVKDGKTFFWAGKYHNDMNTRDTLVTELNVLADFNPVVPENYRDSEVVLLGNLHPEVQSSVLDQMTAPKLVILDTMNFWMALQLNTLLNVIKQVDIITINDEEALQLSGEANLVLAAKAIHKMGPAYVIIKKGEHGALLFYQDQPFFAPALPLEKVVDPTGAGDSFAGGLSGYLAAQQTTDAQVIKAGILHGTAAASLCVGTMGTTGLVQSSKEDFLVQLHKLERLRTIST
jgi:sugar/nucleoside kinase (ribokinase family)